jgi:hypothetical protein
LRVLEFLKSNYSRLAETITLRWQNGLYVPLAGPSSLDRAAREANADTVAFNYFSRDEMNLSNNPHAGNYAPRVFAKTSEAKQHGLTERDLEAAMQRLLAAGKIRVERYGRPSEPRFRLVINR